MEDICCQAQCVTLLSQPQGLVLRQTIKVASSELNCQSLFGNLERVLFENSSFIITNPNG